jgi:hypothetical protein
MCYSNASFFFSYSSFSSGFIKTGNSLLLVRHKVQRCCHMGRTQRGWTNRVQITLPHGTNNARSNILTSSFACQLPRLAAAKPCQLSAFAFFFFMNMFLCFSYCVFIFYFFGGWLSAILNPTGNYAAVSQALSLQENVLSYLDWPPRATLP